MSGETVLITGASSGIGLELARCFARAGDNLLLTGRDAAALGALAEELRRDGRVTVTTFIAELGDSAGISRLLEQIAATGRAVDVVVNNAGFAVHGHLWTIDSVDDEALNSVQIHAPLRLIKAFVPGMLQRRRGGVLNIASVYSYSPTPWQAVYGAAKSWLLSLSLSLREELRGAGVNVTVVCPGTTLSRFRSRKGLPDRPSSYTMTCAEVAVAAHRGFRRGDAVVVPGGYYKLYVLAARLLPARWLGRFVYLTAYRLRGMPVPPLPNTALP